MIQPKSGNGCMREVGGCGACVSLSCHAHWQKNGGYPSNNAWGGGGGGVGTTLNGGNGGNNQKWQKWLNANASDA